MWERKPRLFKDNRTESGCDSTHGGDDSDLSRFSSTKKLVSARTIVHILIVVWPNGGFLKFKLL